MNSRHFKSYIYGFPFIYGKLTQTVLVALFFYCSVCKHVLSDYKGNNNDVTVWTNKQRVSTEVDALTDIYYLHGLKKNCTLCTSLTMISKFFKMTWDLCVDVRVDPTLGAV